MASWFFELLVEEIPAWMIDARLDVLREKLSVIVTEFSGVAPEEGMITAGATPRRIWLSLEGLPERQASRTEEIKGPPLRAARREDGTATPALEGFLRKNGLTSEQVQERDGYVWATRTSEGASLGATLQERIPAVIEGLRWPRMMRWGSGSQSFIRPVHSIVSVLDGEHLPMTIFGVGSGTATRGHRTLAPAAIEVSSFAEYRERLEQAHVVIDADERVSRMRKSAHTLASEANGNPARDESIWLQWKYLSEAPGLVRAEFDEEFLSLPEEVLVTVMRVHQKQLPIESKDRITNSFLAVVDHHGDPDGNARAGNAFVTNARFADARFFYEADRKKSLESRFEELSHLQFQEKLGDYRAKTERIVRLALALHREAGLKSDIAGLESAARLSKCDLVTEMVKEFTELQGKIGGIYAREEGADEEVWQAVYDHYLPASLEGQLPRGEAGALVALADKLDTLAGFFSIGLRPTGSRDPFALRRAAQGAVQILLNRAGWSISIAPERALVLSLEGYERGGDQETLAQLVEFFEERVRTLLESPPFSYPYDGVDAVLAAGWTSSLHGVHDRLAALSRIRDDAQFLSILDAARRIANITADGASIEIRQDLLEHPTEQRLSALVDLTSAQVDELIAAGDFDAALQAFAALAPELETFFNDVLVNADNEKVRENRKALLRRTGRVVGKLAEVTRIVVDRRELRDAR